MTHRYPKETYKLHERADLQTRAEFDRMDKAELQDLIRERIQVEKRAGVRSLRKDELVELARYIDNRDIRFDMLLEDRDRYKGLYEDQKERYETSMSAYIRFLLNLPVRAVKKVVSWRS